MKLRVTSASKTAAFEPDEVIVIGRREDDCCQFGLDPDDRTISRRAVTLHFDRLWWIVNTSSHQQVRVRSSHGEGEVLAYGERRAVDREAVTIVVLGRARHHRVTVSVHLPTAVQPSLGAPADPRPTIGEIIALTEAERDALAALFHEFLEGRDDRNPRPESYADAAALLPRPVPPTAVRKRFERVVERLRQSGIPGLEGAELKRLVAQFLIGNGILTGADLRRLRRGRPRSDGGA